MEELRANRIAFFLHILLLFRPLVSSQSDYTSPNKYFINCGSDSNVTLNRRNFIGDEKSSSLSVSFSHSSTTAKATNSSTATTPLYQTARIFKDRSFYDLDIDQNGTYMVRLHFAPFANLFNARFNISTSKVLLLSKLNFKDSSSISPLIEEFILTINIGKFRFYFAPSDDSSIAFVNAIEAFLAPENFIPDSVTTHATPGGSNGVYNGLLSQVLHVVHRINVGGGMVTPENDTLWRNWLSDDDYLFFKDAAKNFTGDIPHYQDGGATIYIAPYLVYMTLKELNITDMPYSLLNVTWKFPVNRSASHFVRLHFCDFISPSFDDTWFNLYIYRQYSQMMNTLRFVNQLATPFYMDFVVDSDNSGFMNISIGPRSDSKNKNAFLNGLEIMRFMTDLSSTTAKSEPKEINLFVIIGSVVGGVAFVLILMAVLFFTLRYRTKKPVETSNLSPGPQCDGSSYTRFTELTGNGSPIPNLGLKLSFAEILYATNHFDAKLMIGEGGFGKVYKGILQNGTIVAVKRSEPGKGQGLPEFQTEIMVLSRIRHHHLVSLIGYCDERSEMILVYEFMEKGTLRDLLYDSNEDSKKTSSQAKLSWNQRLEICIGAAKGLNYLHTGLNEAIIHRDVKSTNILLDGNYVAKVADFGISRSGSLDQTHVSTDVKGTFGYLDPEYFRCLQLTQKSDVYSFGVVLLEVLCVRPAINNMLPWEQVNLVDWGISWQRKGQIEEILDPLLVGQINPSSLRKFGEIAEKCLKEHSAERPNMIDVLWDLEYALLLQQTAVHREPHEDSTTDVSMELPFPVIARLPTYISQSINEEEMPVGTEDDSDLRDINASKVFSQLRINKAR